MQNQAALAYQQVGKQTVNPRDLEANLLSKSAGNLQRIRDDWDDTPHGDLPPPCGSIASCGTCS